MRAVVLRHIHELGAEITHKVAVVGHVLHAHSRAHGDVLRRLNEVVIAVERSRHLRHVRYHGDNVLYLQLADRQREVLQGFGVVVVRIYLYVNAVVRPHSQPRRDALVVAKEDVVVLVNVKFLVSYDRVVGEQTHLDAVLLHLGNSAKTYAEHVFLVVVSHVERGSRLLQITVEEGVEHVLRVSVVVAHLTVEPQLRVVREEREAHRVELHAVGEQAVYLHITVESSLWRRSKVHPSGIEGIAVTLQNAAHEVVAAGVELDARRGQQLAESHLVYLPHLEVVLRLCHEFVHLLQQHLIAATCVHIDVEVAVACHQVGGVATCKKVDVDIVGEVSRLAFLHHQVAHGAHNTVVLVLVGGDVEVGAERCRQRSVREFQLVEVDMCEVGADGRFHLLASKQCIEINISLYQRVVALHVGDAVTVGHSHRSTHSTEVVATIRELLDINISVYPCLGGIDVGAVAFQFYLAAESAEVLLG